MGDRVNELRKKRDAAKLRVQSARALSSDSFERWQAQIAKVDSTENELRQTELALAEELWLHHGWKFPKLNHKPGRLESAIDDFLWELEKKRKQ